MRYASTGAVELRNTHPFVGPDRHVTSAVVLGGPPKRHLTLADLHPQAAVSQAEPVFAQP